MAGIQPHPCVLPAGMGLVERPGRGWQFPWQAGVRADLNTGSGSC